MADEKAMVIAMQVQAESALQAMSQLQQSFTAFAASARQSLGVVPIAGTEATRGVETLYDKMRDLKGEAVQHERVFAFFGRELASVAGIGKETGAALTGVFAGLGSGMGILAAVEGLKLIVGAFRESSEAAKKLEEDWKKSLDGMARAAEDAKDKLHVFEDLQPQGWTRNMLEERTAMMRPQFELPGSKEKVSGNEAQVVAETELIKLQKELAEAQERQADITAGDQTSVIAGLVDQIQRWTQVKASVDSYAVSLRKLRQDQDAADADEEARKAGKAAAAERSKIGGLQTQTAVLQAETPQDKAQAEWIGTYTRIQQELADHTISAALASAQASEAWAKYEAAIKKAAEEEQAALDRSEKAADEWAAKQDKLAVDAIRREQERQKVLAQGVNLQAAGFDFKKADELDRADAEGRKRRGEVQAMGDAGAFGQGDEGASKLKAALAQVDAQWDATRAKILAGTVDINKGLETGANLLMSSFRRAFDQILSGHANMAKVMDQLWKGIANAGLDALQKVAMEAITNALTAKTAAVAGNEAEAQSGAALVAVNSMASAAAIPFTGWAMAPGVAAANYEIADTFASMASFDTGAWKVPATGMAMVHQDELIASPRDAPRLRSMLEGAQSGGGDSGGDVHNHFHLDGGVLDGDHLLAMLRRNGRVLGRALSEMDRRGGL